MYSANEPLYFCTNKTCPCPTSLTFEIHVRILFLPTSYSKIAFELENWTKYAAYFCLRLCCYLLFMSCLKDIILIKNILIFASFYLYKERYNKTLVGQKFRPTLDLLCKAASSNIEIFFAQ